MPPVRCQRHRQAGQKLGPVYLHELLATGSRPTTNILKDHRGKALYRFTMLTPYLFPLSPFSLFIVCIINILPINFIIIASLKLVILSESRNTNEELLSNGMVS